MWRRVDLVSSRVRGFATLGVMGVLVLSGCEANPSDDVPQEPLHVIFDTDVGGDVDDAGALAVLHALADRSEIEILAIGVSIGHEAAVPFVHAVNTWYGRANLPVGTVKEGASYARDEFMEEVVPEYPHTFTRESAPDVVELYRAVLANQPDRSVTMITVGPATNMYNLLRSGPDQFSDLTGVELVGRKLEYYGAGGNGGGNLPSGRCGFNCYMDIEAASGELQLMPTNVPVVFAGGSGPDLEVGSALTGARPDHIIRRAYEAYYDGVARDRFSWDQLRVLYGSRPSVRTLWDTSPTGTIVVGPDSTIAWSPSPNSNHAYAYVNDLDAVGTVLTELMLHDPRDDSLPSSAP